MIEDRFFSVLPLTIKQWWFDAVAFITRPRMEKLYAQFIQQGDLVFDIGANFGEFTDVFLSLGATVIAVEPLPECVKFLEEKFSEDPNVVLEQVGVGEKKSKAKLYVSSRDMRTSTFSQRFMNESRYSERVWDRTVDVPIVRLPDLIEKYGTPQFCKIDTEGYELPIVKGMESKIPVITFEFHGEFLGDTKECLQQLMKLGYRKFNYTVLINYRYASKRWLTADELLTALHKRKGRYFGGDIYAK